MRERTLFQRRPTILYFAVFLAVSDPWTVYQNEADKVFAKAANELQESRKKLIGELNERLENAIRNKNEGLAERMKREIGLAKSVAWRSPKQLIRAISGTRWSWRYGEREIGTVRFGKGVIIRGERPRKLRAVSPNIVREFGPNGVTGEYVFTSDLRMFLYYPTKEGAQVRHAKRR